MMVYHRKVFPTSSEADAALERLMGAFPPPGYGTHGKVSPLERPEAAMCDLCAEGRGYADYRAREVAATKRGPDPHPRLRDQMRDLCDWHAEQCPEAVAAPEMRFVMTASRSSSCD